MIKINKRYLLFDSSCSECTRVAESFREISDDWLEIKSLHSDKIKSLLNEHHPNWKWEPQIIEFINDKVKVHSGIGMQFYILKGLGLRKSIRLSRVLKSVNLQNVSGRRRFLRKSSILFGGLLLSPILSTLLPKSFANKVSAEVSNSKNKHWLEKVDIVDSKELTSYEIEKSIGSTLQQDLKESTINNNIFMNSEKLGVIHKLSDNNTLKAISVTKDDKVIVNYSLSSAIDNFRTGTFVYELDDKSQDHIMVEEIVNGSKPLDVTLQSKCGDCSLQNFTYSLADAGCGRIDASCVATCCVPCGWGGGVPCLLIWCPTCLFLCCDGPPGGSKCYSCA